MPEQISVLSTVSRRCGFYRYSLTGIGDVKALQGIHKGKLRLRLGDYRVFFNAEGEILRILRVRHRSEAYR